MNLAGREYQTLQTAIATLQATAGMKTVKVDVRPLAIDHPNPRANAVLTITLNGHKRPHVPWPEPRKQRRNATISR